MKQLFQATFEQSLKLNNDDVLMECMEKSTTRAILYRMLGPWSQGLSLWVVYVFAIFSCMVLFLQNY